MKKIGTGFTLILSAMVVVGCRPSQSNADTTNVAASSTPPGAAAQSGADTTALTPSSSPASKTATSVKRTASSTKSGKSDSRTQQRVGQDTILGYDSVIRGPVKMLPTATSTPNRK